jgi:hypothetical protein
MLSDVFDDAKLLIASEDIDPVRTDRREEPCEGMVWEMWS